MWIREPEQRLWLLAGDGGKGKTAIAYEFATRVAEDAPKPLDVVIWLSAKRQRFLEGHAAEIETPDFWDLGSALERVLSAYGWLHKSSADMKQRQEEALDHLEVLPALVILDDIDSLEGEGLKALAFFVWDVTRKTRSKVLLTSRRVPYYGMEAFTCQVEGFQPASQEGRQYVHSRIVMFGLDPSTFSVGIVDQLIRDTDGSPLYIEDLLRLCKVGVPVSQAIREWKQRGGELARRYALGRELESLTRNAREVLLACALWPGPVSLSDIQAATALKSDGVQSAVTELQQLFLVPRPRLIQDVPRFDLNLNTRQLVLETEADSERKRRIESATKALVGKLQSTFRQHNRISEFVRQAVTLVVTDKHSEAEATLKAALKEYPENPDLLGQLGWVYKNWKSTPRITDAREHFLRSAQLQCTQFEMFRHWTEMEYSENEWTHLEKAGEAALKIFPGNLLFRYRAGYALSRLSRQLMQEAQYGRAREEAQKAIAHLEKALIPPEELQTGEYLIHSQTYRALVLTCETLIRIAWSQHNTVDMNYSLRECALYLRRWNAEHPGDKFAADEAERLALALPGLREMLDKVGT